MCSHNQDSIEICSVQQVRTGGGLLYTESWHLKHMLAGMLAELWACTDCYTKSATSCWSHITMCWSHITMCRSQYHGVPREGRLLWF